MQTPPNYSGQPLGFDVSHNNGVVDWSVIDTDIVKFVGIKCTQGVDFVDPQFSANWTGAWACGLRRIAYLFLDPLSDTSLQTDLFLQQIHSHQGADGDLYALDIEGAAWDCLDEIERAQKIVNASAQIKASSGHDPILYYSPGWFAGMFDVPTFVNWPTWIARYGVDSPGAECLIWQFSENGSVVGVGDGTVDLDVWMGGWE